MADDFVIILTLMMALGSGLIGGLFFAFSTSVMKALGELPLNEGIAAMQRINLVILNPAFLGIFLGTALTSVVLTVIGVALPDAYGSVWLVTGALLYIIGNLLVTMAFNVPMNNALAAADPASPEGQELWKKYLADWTFWNHVRTIASLLASGSFVLGLYYSK